jgi:acyl-CoA thioester hydrolase
MTTMSGETAKTDPLASYPIVVELPVSWGDMDAFGHLNNTVYFRYFESARIAFLEAIGFADGGPGGGIGAILASTHCRFRRPLLYPDSVRVGTRATDVGDDRFGMEYVVVSTALGEVAAEGGAVVVAYDYDVRRKAPLPDAVRARMDRLITP